MKRRDAIATIVQSLRKSDAVISTTGLISREVFETYDSAQHFYIPGSMGLVSSVGLGISLNTQKRVIVLDGDASLLMNLGAIVTIGCAAPRNLLHIVLDNNAYGSCSEECSMSDVARLARLARVVGYHYVRTVSNRHNLETAIRKFYRGPGFVLVKIALGGRRDLARPLALAEIKKRFMLFMSQKGDAS